MKNKNKSKSSTLTGVLPNGRGGWKIETPLTEDHLPVINAEGQGLYAWMTKTAFLALLNKTLLYIDAIGKIKFGQFGANAKKGNTSAPKTIASYAGPGDTIVILKVWPLNYKSPGASIKIEKQVQELLGKPISDGFGKEWWNTSISKIEKAIESVLATPLVTIPYVPSPDTEEAIKKMIANKRRYFGLFATMRHGKSFDYLEYIKRIYPNNSCYHLMLCHDTSSYTGWLNKIKNSYSDCIDVYELRKNKKVDFSSRLSKNTVILVSPQFISASEPNGGEINYDKKINFLAKYKIKAENIFVDEAHNYFTPRWEAYYESIVGGGQIILATGTSANLAIRHADKFDEDNTYYWGIDKLKERVLKDLNIEINSEIRLLQLENTDGSNVNIANLQSLENDQLANEPQFEEMIKNLFDRNKRYSPIYRCGNHAITVVDTVPAARALKKFILKYGKNQVVPILVAGPKARRDAKNETEINKIIEDAEREGKRTITISCGSMIQGVSVRWWKNILNFSSKSTYEIYYQLFGRGYEFDKEKDDHRNEKHPFKVNIVMWDFNPHRIYNIVSEFVDGRTKHNGGDQDEAHRYYFETVNILEYINGQNAWQKKNMNELCSKVKEILNKKVYHRGLTINTCLSREFNINDIDSRWAEFALSKEWSGAKQQKIRKESIDIWNQELKRQKRDHVINQHKHEDGASNKIIEDTRAILKKSVESVLSKLEIVWSVYKSRGLVKTSINELFERTHESEFLSGTGLDNKELADIFINIIKKYGLIDRINAKIQKSHIYTAASLLKKNRNDFLNKCDEMDKMFNFDGDDTQISTRKAYEILKKKLVKIKAKKGDIFHVPYAKSGSINLALSYLLKEMSIEIFGKQLTDKEIVNSITFHDNNSFFSFLNESVGFKKPMKNKKKFIIINPPYKAGLHIEIFNTAFDEELEDGGVLICLHPATPFINRKPTRDDDKTKRIKEIVSKYKTRLTLVDGNTLFENAAFFAPLSITRVEKVLDKKIEVIYSHIDSTNKEVKVYDKLDDIFIHGNDIVLKIKDKIFSKMTHSLEDYNGRTDVSKKHNSYIRTMSIGGHVPKNGKLNPDFFCLIYKSDENDLNKLLSNTFENGYNYIGCLNKKNAVNMFEYFKTKFVRFAISLYKLNQTLHRGELMSVPYMDFSQEWTDEKLFNYFELTQEEREFINTYIQNWYDRDFK